jgi:hypothetical protein
VKIRCLRVGFNFKKAQALFNAQCVTEVYVAIEKPINHKEVLK